MVQCGHPVLSVERQCELLDLSRSSFYYTSARDNANDWALMRLLDEEYTSHLFRGMLFIAYLFNHPVT